MWKKKNEKKSNRAVVPIREFYKKRCLTGNAKIH